MALQGAQHRGVRVVELVQVDLDTGATHQGQCMVDEPEQLGAVACRQASHGDQLDGPGQFAGTDVNAQPALHDSSSETRSEVGERGRETGSHEDWTVEELKGRAKELGITGCSDLRKGELIDTLRDHWTGALRH